MIITERLKSARKACKLTQGQVADMLGIDRSAYTYYEIGKTSPNLDNLVRLAAMFNVDVLWLLGRDNGENSLADSDSLFLTKSEVAETDITELTGDERQLVAFYRMLKKTGDVAKMTDAFAELRNIEKKDDKQSD